MSTTKTSPRRLLTWAERARERGSLDLLGPSTSAAVTAWVANGPLDVFGRSAATNGAAMRIAPVGLVAASNDLAALVDLVVEASRVTHYTTVAIAGAAAVAAAVSAGIGGGSVADATALAIRSAELGQQRGEWVAGASLARRIPWAIGLIDIDDHDRSVGDGVELVGTSIATQESVPAAFAILALHPNDPWQASDDAARTRLRRSRPRDRDCEWTAISGTVATTNRPGTSAGLGARLGDPGSQMASSRSAW
jgi:ADP-ribosylglycohydrolase